MKKLSAPHFRELLKSQFLVYMMRKKRVLEEKNSLSPPSTSRYSKYSTPKYHGHENQNPEVSIILHFCPIVSTFDKNKHPIQPRLLRHKTL